MSWRNVEVAYAYGCSRYRRWSLWRPDDGSICQRRDRIELRATPEEKRLLSQAAAYQRLDVTGFIMRAALPAAREAVEQAERIVLTERDTARVLELLENPPEPSPALLAAGRRRHTSP